MSGDRRHEWDAQGDIEDGHLGKDSSSSDDIANDTKYVPNRSGSPVKVFFTRREAESRRGKASIPTVKPLFIEKFKMEKGQTAL